MNVPKQSLIFSLLMALSLAPLYSADFGQEQSDCSAQTGLAFAAGAVFVASTTFILLFGPQFKQLGAQRVSIAPRVTSRSIKKNSALNDNLDQQFSSSDDEDKPKRHKAGWSGKIASSD